MFHTVTFASPEEAPPIFIPDPEVEAPATPDPAAMPKLILNPILMTGAGGTVVDGSELVSTGVDVFSDPSVQWVFSFPTPGTYDYVCIPHVSNMQGRVVVQEAGSDLPADQAAYDQMAADAMAAMQADGLAQIEMYSTPAQSEKADGGTLWEVAAGVCGSPSDSIKYIIQSEGEPHTATFLGEGEEAPADIIEETFADGMPKLVQSMETFLPQGGNTWSGTGFVNSGFMGIPAIGLPMEWEVLFDTPGQYVVYCILHGGPDGSRMASTVTVNEA
ncbi:hypothetical protein BH23CHL5_BH23CHL5_23810 [soil metagenome]